MEMRRKQEGGGEGDILVKHHLVAWGIRSHARLGPPHPFAPAAVPPPLSPHPHFLFFRQMCSKTVGKKKANNGLLSFPPPPLFLHLFSICSLFDGQKQFIKVWRNGATGPI